ncbi:MAG: DUF445 domain-containing protein [Tepidanaerobacteraceae bacterium]|jgi:uncharacterized membrane protein YheB (UPF0754 family)|nr:DUF445 family protein [Thermoanaerobacterales bacterium]
MNTYIHLISMPFIGGFIGWGTNLLAIKLIFRPLKPIKIPVLGLEIQGLIPKRRFEIARNIGEALEQDLVSPEEIIEALASEKTKAETIKYIKHAVVKKTYEKLPGFIPSSLNEYIANYLGDMIDRHGNEIFDELKTVLAKKAKEQLRLKDIVEQKINSFDLVELEDLIIMLSKRELKHIEILGGVIGFLIGIVQAVFTFFLMKQ